MTDEVFPSRHASRLCSDKGANHNVRGPQTLTPGLRPVWPTASQLPPKGMAAHTQRGSLLDPSTVNTGTTLLYIGGSILVVLAAILLITKRRMNAED